MQKADEVKMTIGKDESKLQAIFLAIKINRKIHIQWYNKRAEFGLAKSKTLNPRPKDGGQEGKKKKKRGRRGKVHII